MKQLVREREKISQNRIIGLDLIRSFAILFVLARHFFYQNTPFRSSVFEGVSMFIQVFFNSLFAIGVPLFLLLTGH